MPTANSKVCSTVHLVPPLLPVATSEIVVHRRKGTFRRPASNYIENAKDGKDIDG